MKQLIEGTFESLLFSPKGRVEGALVSVGNEVAQLTLQKDDERSGRLLTELAPGQSVSVNAEPAGRFSKGDASHPVHMVKDVVAINGKRATTIGAKHRGDAFRGKVQRIHFAKHGEANGVVLDTGDFVHLKPDGFKAARLKVGDAVEARGEARRLETGAGSVVEAIEVNGKAVGAKPKH